MAQAVVLNNSVLADVIGALAPDWRWAEARALLNKNERPPRSLEDAAVKRAWKFLRRTKDAAPVDLLSLRRDYPHTAAAYALHLRGADGERWIVEAGLLTDVDVSDLAAYVGLLPEDVEEYGRLFWDVRSRLHCRGWIMNRVFGGLDSPTRADGPAIYKGVAYLMGWKAFRSWLELGYGDARLDEMMAGAFRSELVRKGLQAAVKVRVDQKNARGLIEQCRMMLDPAAAAAPTGGVGVTDGDRLDRILAAANMQYQPRGLGFFVSDDGRWRARDGPTPALEMATAKDEARNDN